MYNENFLRGLSSTYGLSEDQEIVFLLRFMENCSNEQIAARLDISVPACAKRMGEVYRKFGITGKARGKEQRLRAWLHEMASQQAESPKTSAEQPQSTHRHNPDEHSLEVTASSSLPNSFAQSLEDWFNCLGHEVDQKSIKNDDCFEWVIWIKNRRGYDRIVVHSITKEVQAPHVHQLHQARIDHNADEGWVVAPLRVSKLARQQARELTENPKQPQLFCYTFDELIDEDIDFTNYFQLLEDTIQQQSIQDKYIDLACQKVEFIPDTKRTIGYSEYGEAEGWIDGYVDSWLDDPAKEHLSILGEFGSGKTWFTLHYAWKALQRYKDAKERGVKRPRLPLLIPLRNFSKAANVESIFSDLLFRKNEIKIPSYRVFEKLNSMGKLMLIFDGFDEMAFRVNHQTMINNFWSLATVVVPGSKVILTCRTEHFPTATEGRALLSAELQASTQSRTPEAPQFEILQIKEFDNDQIRQVLASRATPEVIEQFMSLPELVSLASRPLMIDLILDALPDVQSGKPIDLARTYLYAIRRKMEQDIKSERTFTSLADKLYFLCELSWEMLSTDQMSLRYDNFPGRIRDFFGDAVSDENLDHWQYDMMGQTMLIRDEDGRYKPAHRSFLEFFVAYKFAAELGCLATDFREIAQQQNIDETKQPKCYKWSNYFRHKSDAKGIIPIAALQEFETESLVLLSKTLGGIKLTQALLSLIIPMLKLYEDEQSTVKIKLLNILSTLKQQRQAALMQDDYLVGNIITLLLKVSHSALEGQDLSDLLIRGADFTNASLRNLDLSNTRLLDCTLPQGWGGDLSVTFSPDGCFLAIVDSTGEISVWNTNEEKLSWQKKGHTDWIRAVAFNKDGTILATGSHDQTIKLWNVQTGDFMKSLENAKRVYTLAFSQSDDTLASGGDEKVIKLWNIKDGNYRILEGHLTWIGALAFGQNRKSEILASGSDDGIVKTWNVGFSGECIHSFTASQRGIHSLAFDPEDKVLAIGSSESAVKLWDLKNSECLPDLEGHTDWIRSVSFNESGLLASGSNDGAIRLWNLETQTCFSVLKGHTTRVWSVAFSNDQKTLASGSDDRTIKLWNVETHECTKTFWGKSRGLWSIAFSANNQTLYCGSDDSLIQSWNIQSPENKAFPGHKGRVRAVALSEQTQLLASGSDDTTIQLWSLQTNGQLEYRKTLNEHSDWVWSVAFSPDGKTLASGSLDETVMIWDTEAGKHQRTLRGHDDFVWSVAWSPTDSFLASGSADQTIRLWEPRTGADRGILKGHQHQVTSVAFAPNGAILASGSDDGTVKIWDLKTQQCIQTLQHKNQRQLRAVAFNPDGNVLATAGLDCQIRLWRWNTCELLQTISHHNESVFSLAFSPDGKRLISAGEGGIVYLSDPRTGAKLDTLQTDSPYQGLDITNVQGLTASQISLLVELGAISHSESEYAD